MKKKNQAPVERFEVDMSQGLRESQVSLRQSQKLTNLTKKSSGKSYTRIICENVFTLEEIEKTADFLFRYIQNIS